MPTEPFPSCEGGQLTAEQIAKLTDERRDEVEGLKLREAIVSLTANAFKVGQSHLPADVTLTAGAVLIGSFEVLYDINARSYEVTYRGTGIQEPLFHSRGTVTYVYRPGPWVTRLLGWASLLAELGNDADRRADAEAAAKASAAAKAAYKRTTLTLPPVPNGDVR